MMVEDEHDNDEDEDEGGCDIEAPAKNALVGVFSLEI